MVAVGERGPVPKRSEESLGHKTKAEKNAVSKAPGAAEVAVPAADEQWHPIARRWYESLAESGQSRYYEPSDWWTAQYLAEAMSRNLSNERFSAQLFAAVMSGATELMTTEGARRRLRLELQRPAPEDAAEVDGDGASVTQLDEYRDLYG